jgi:hypothetical protein
MGKEAIERVRSRLCPLFPVSHLILNLDELHIIEEEW